MADGISFSMVTDGFRKGLDQRQARIPSASMWALRAAGRVTARAAKAAAPVLKDKTVSSHRQLQQQRRQGVDVSAAYGRPVPGLLKASIAPSRRLQRVGDGWSLKVGPRGERVHLYSAKIEEQVDYMEQGRIAAEASLKVYAEQAIGRVWR
jgi:hypothetical protein